MGGHLPPLRLTASSSAAGICRQSPLATPTFAADTTVAACGWSLLGPSSSPVSLRLLAGGPLLACPCCPSHHGRLRAVSAWPALAASVTAATCGWSPLATTRPPTLLLLSAGSRCALPRHRRHESFMC